MTVGYHSMPWTPGEAPLIIEGVRYRLFGSSGLRVSELFLGTMTFGEDWGWGAPPEECRRMFDAYAEAGGNVVDTAVNYTDGASEQIVGELLGSQRDHFVVSTKFTLSTDPSDPNASGSHRKNLLRSLELSLRRLRTDRIDIYWVHIWDPNTPVEETMRALDDAVRAGKVLYVGVSDTPAWVISRANTLAEWRDWSPVAGIQVPYSLVQRDAERELLPMAASATMSVAAWSPLAGGILSGKFTHGDAPPAASRVAADTISERDLAVARTVQDVADDLGVTPSQVAIAWTRARNPTVHPIVGARRLDQLVDNLGAVDCHLDPQSLQLLDDASAISLGFPHDFIRETVGLVYGAAAERVLPRRSRP
jgi:aryl-alcohol dehydrogenase-like predicted oxidoreductase